MHSFQLVFRWCLGVSDGDVHPVRGVPFQRQKSQSPCDLEAPFTQIFLQLYLHLHPHSSPTPVNSDKVRVPRLGVLGCWVLLLTAGPGMEPLSSPPPPPLPSTHLDATASPHQPRAVTHPEPGGHVFLCSTSVKVSLCAGSGVQQGPTLGL